MPDAAAIFEKAKQMEREVIDRAVLIVEMLETPAGIALMEQITKLEKSFTIPAEAYMAVVENHGFVVDSHKLTFDVGVRTGVEKVKMWLEAQKKVLEAAAKRNEGATEKAE